MTTEIYIKDTLYLVLRSQRLEGAEKHNICRLLYNQRLSFQKNASISEISDDIGQIIDLPDGTTQIRSRATIFNQNGTRTSNSYDNPIILSPGDKVSVAVKGLGKKILDKAILTIKNV